MRDNIAYQKMNKWLIFQKKYLSIKVTKLSQSLLKTLTNILSNFHLSSYIECLFLKFKLWENSSIIKRNGKIKISVFSSPHLSNFNFSCVGSCITVVQKFCKDVWNSNSKYHMEIFKNKFLHFQNYNGILIHFSTLLLFFMCYSNSSVYV